MESVKVALAKAGIVLPEADVAFLAGQMAMLAWAIAAVKEAAK